MKYYIIDAFTDVRFKGNPAGVCLLDEWIDDDLMQNIASENNLAETAFVVPREECFALRWFTPSVEIDLCGHATLASAYVISNFVDSSIENMRFQTAGGVLTVKKMDDLYEMDFPARKAKPIQITPLMEQAVGTAVLEACQARDIILRLANEEAVKTLKPDLSLISKLPDCFALIVTSEGDKVEKTDTIRSVFPTNIVPPDVHGGKVEKTECQLRRIENASSHSPFFPANIVRPDVYGGDIDFVSRFFAPNAGIPEDPVTGSAHSELIPFWSERLRKNKMTAKQLSKRGGTLFCENCGERVKIAGKASLYLRGEIEVG